MAAALVEAFRAPIGTAQVIEEIVLIPSGKGKYEISVNEKLVYSKLATGKHITDDAAIGLIRAEAR